MRYHPAVLMLAVWLICIAAFYILPFQLENRVMTLYGFLILMLFIATFCVGALWAGRPQPQRPRRTDVTIDFLWTDRLLIGAAVVAVLASLIDTAGRNLFDLADAYQMRSDKAGALLAGSQSDSSIWFQFAFLTYPAGYIYLIREVAFRPRPVLWKVIAFGIAPVLMTSLAMGGRAPLFYALLMLAYAFNLRKQLFPKAAPTARRSVNQGGPTSPRRPHRTFHLGAPAKAAISVLGLFMSIYFVEVFFARADVAGGVDVMFGVAGSSWGVNFNGEGSGLLFALLGADGTYLVFVFVWYLVQGFVMSNALFSSYDGSMLLGTYGIDLASALMRRINGEFVADGFAVLVDMNTYGFLPSAFGSLFVDFKFFGLIPCFIWGWLAGTAYVRVKRGGDPRWLMVVPILTVGIFFSLINTPIGFSNGFVIHLWLAVAFVSARLRPRAPVGSVPPRGHRPVPAR